MTWMTVDLEKRPSIGFRYGELKEEARPGPLCRSCFTKETLGKTLIYIAFWYMTIVLQDLWVINNSSWWVPKIRFHTCYRKMRHKNLLSSYCSLLKYGFVTLFAMDMLWQSFSWWKIIIAYEILYYNHTIIHKNNKVASNLDALHSCPLPKGAKYNHNYTTTTCYKFLLQEASLHFKVQNSMNLTTHTLLVPNYVDAKFSSYWHHETWICFEITLWVWTVELRGDMTTLIQDDCVGNLYEQIQKFKSRREVGTISGTEVVASTLLLHTSPSLELVPPHKMG